MQVVEPLTYIGPGRRSDKTVIEWPLQLSADEQQAFRLAVGRGREAVCARLQTLGCHIPRALAEQSHGPGANAAGAAAEVARWVAEIALAMQQTAGHRVAFSAALPGPAPERCRMVFEYEHISVGEDAGELAMRLLAESIPGLEWITESELPGESLEDAFSRFLERAAKRVLPLDAEAIIDAAAALDVPCVKLEREPYGGLPGDFRIRRNGLLKLGHSCYQHIVDGTLCIDRNPALVPLLFDREKLFHRMIELNLPVPHQDREFRNLITAKRAIRAAERVGYPVVLKPARRSRQKGNAARGAYMPLGSAGEVRGAFEQARGIGQRVIVEQFIAGTTFHLLLANHQPVCVVTPGSSPVPVSALHRSILDLAVRVSHSLDAGLLVVTVVTPDPGRSLDAAGGAVIDLDPAPQLDRLLRNDAALLARAAEAYVRWLFPPGSPCRIPLIAVTGTNGKTTTCRMISRIMRTAGFSPGMASTSGIYFNEVLQQEGDQAGSGGHHVLFESPDIDMGVLETARGAVAHSGFMFDWCDAAVCLNVTPEHIGEYGIETLDQMTALKRSVLERARGAVVLNADYPTCRAMLPFPGPVTVYLASLTQSAVQLRKLAGTSSFACVLEKQDGEDWIVLHGPGGSRAGIMPVNGIPATMDGAARFNVSNAQHAICACHGLGTKAEVIAEGMSTFAASFENTPGRLNIYRGLPFTVIMDYVHNPDGMDKLSEFTDRMDVPGRRILLYAGTGNRSDREIADFARSAVGHFDLYLCRSYVGLRGRKPGEVPALMKAVLLEAGVEEERITLVAEPERGAAQAMQMARAGDLLVLSPGTDEMELMWREIISFEPGQPG